ncbi:MAG TPA: hypothetical protein VI341_10575 [Actinomycetota bacterium]
MRCVSLGMALFMALTFTPATAASPTSDPVNTRLEAPGIARGGCSGPSRWRLTVRREAGAFRVTLVVRGGPADQRWNIFIDHDGRGFFAGSRVSNANGAVSVRRTASDLRGVDRFRFGANGKHGESCSGRARA